jgi:hypothetical protein
LKAFPSVEKDPVGMLGFEKRSGGMMERNFSGFQKDAPFNSGLKSPLPPL